MTDPPTEDTPTHIRDITQLSSDELDAYVTGLRERRMEPVRHFEAAQRIEREARRTKLTLLLKKQLELFGKDLTRIDKGITKLDQRALKIRALRLEMQFEDDDEPEIREADDQ